MVIKLALLLWFALLPGFARGQIRSDLKVSSNANYSLVEVAPLQGAMGQVSIRGEKPVKGLRIALTYENYRKASEQAGYKDSGHQLSGEAVFNPFAKQLPGFFVSLGAGVEMAYIGRQQERAYVSQINYTEAERYDRWVNKDLYVSAQEAVGYRFNPGKSMTASLRYHFDQRLMAQSESMDEDIKSHDVDTSSNGRPGKRQKIMFHVGIRFY